MRPVDRELVGKIGDLSIREGLELESVTSTLQYIHVENQYVNFSFKKINSSNMSQLMAISQVNAMLHGNTKLAQMQADPSISIDGTLLKTTGLVENVFSNYGREWRRE